MITKVQNSLKIGRNTDPHLTLISLLNMGESSVELTLKQDYKKYDSSGVQKLHISINSGMHEELSRIKDTIIEALIHVYDDGKEQTAYVKYANYCYPIELFNIVVQHNELFREF